MSNDKSVTIDSILSELEVLLLKRDEENEKEKLRLQSTHRDRTIADLFDEIVNLKKLNATLEKLRSSAWNKGYAAAVGIGYDSKLEADARLGRMVRNMPEECILAHKRYPLAMAFWEVHIATESCSKYYKMPEEALESMLITDR